MTSSRSANLGLALAVTGWLITSLGFLFQGGDPPSTMSDSVIERHRDIAIAMLLVGLIFILTSMWLAGRSYAEAKVRSLLAMAVVVVPAIAAVVSLY
jgi:hypothetical protein